MPTRQPSPSEPNPQDDTLIIDNSEEPFAMQIRTLPGDRGIKMIWWYIAIVDEKEGIGGERGVAAERADYEQFESIWAPADSAGERLTYGDDKELVDKAWELVKGTYVDIA
jgi:hypothetical protein